MKNYSKMTDFEINKAVAIVQGYDTEVTQHFSDAGLSVVKTTECSLNYCNSWADAGPIIEQHGISLYRIDGNINAMVTDEDVCGLWYSSGPMEFGYGRPEELQPMDDYPCKNPLRAAMIVFLMTQEAK